MSRRHHRQPEVYRRPQEPTAALAAPKPAAPTALPSQAPKKRPTEVATVPMSAPTVSYRELPVSPDSYFELVEKVRRALIELERGMFRSAADLCDAMLRDDRISGVLDTRINGLLSLPLDFNPPSGDDEAPDAELELAKEIKARWGKMFPQADLEELLRWGIMLNAGLAELVWKTGPDGWVPRIDTWNPRQIWWDWSTRTYKVNTEQGSVELQNPLDGVDAKWLLFMPYGYKRGWMRAKVRALALPWLIRAFARRDWARHSEVQGSAIKVANVPQTATLEDRQKFVRAVAALGSNTTIEAVTLPDGTKFSLELVEAMANTWEGFDKLLEHADTAIAIVLLGQNLTTEVHEGSRAAAQVHDKVRKDFQAGDALKLGGAIQEQALQPYAQFNQGDAELAPFPAWQTEPPEDTQQTADGLQKLGTFLTAVKTSAAPVDVRALLEEQGVPLLSPEEEAKQKQEAAERAAQAQQAMQQQGQPDDAGEGGAPPPKPGQEQLSGRDTLPPGARRGQSYIDLLVEKATAHSANVLDVDLQHLKQLVQLSTSPADLRRRLVTAYANMNFSQLVMLVERATVLAELAGQRSVLDDA